jgi:hypothetical protein
VVVVRDGNGKVSRITCACGAQSEWRLAGRMPPAEIIQKHFIQQGWRLDRHAALCPACQQKRKPIMEKQKAAAPLSLALASHPSEAARAAKKLVFMALMDYYDEAAKAYKPGHSDAKIATECGVAEDFVRKLREADFGPLAAPSELQALHAEVIAQRKHLDEVEARMMQACRRNGWVLG